jgi:hypothetical protein
MKKILFLVLLFTGVANAQSPDIVDLALKGTTITGDTAAAWVDVRDYSEVEVQAFANDSVKLPINFWAAATKDGPFYIVATTVGDTLIATSDAGVFKGIALKGINASGEVNRIVGANYLKLAVGTTLSGTADDSDGVLVTIQYKLKK